MKNKNFALYDIFHFENVKWRWQTRKREGISRERERERERERDGEKCASKLSRGKSCQWVEVALKSRITNHVKSLFKTFDTFKSSAHLAVPYILKPLPRHFLKCIYNNYTIYILLLYVNIRSWIRFLYKCLAYSNVRFFIVNISHF